MVASVTPKPVTYRVTRNGRDETLSYQAMFHAGYRLVLNRNYAEAARVFELLSQMSDRGPRAHILLALCQAQLKDYTACSQTLNRAFDGESSNLESNLHGVFVFWACGLLSDVRSELEAMIQQYPNLPTLSLLLADLLAQSGNQKAPPRFWRLAINNDRQDGAVGLIARREFNEWSRRLKQASSN